MTMKTRAAFLALAGAVLLSAASADARDVSRSKVLERLEDFRQFFVDFQDAPDSAVPGDLLAECHGVIIMRQYKAGFVFGVKGGDGVILLHDQATGRWSAPAFVVSGEGSFGFQIGGQSVDAIILIMNREGINMLLKTRFKIGVDASAAAGPVGRDAAAKVGAGTALLAYSRAKGLYAGVAFEGGALLNNDKYNRAFYGMDIGIREVLLDRMVSVPVDAYPIIETLQSYTIRNAAGPTPILAQPPASAGTTGAFQTPPAPGPLPEIGPSPTATHSAPAPIEPGLVFTPAPSPQPTTQAPAPAQPAPRLASPQPATSTSLPSASTPVPAVDPLPPAPVLEPWPIAPAEQAALDAEATRAAATAKAAAETAAKAQAEAEAAAAKAAAARVQ